MMLGVHCSVSGGLQNSFDEAAALGLDVFQIFSRNQRQWKAKPISDEEKKAFSEAWAKHPEIKVIFAHCSYLINVASADDELRQKSINGLTDEVKRCQALGLASAVLHPGAAGGHSEEDAMKRIAESLKQVIAETADSKVKILLENTAGQGSHIGYKFEHLKNIMDMVDSDRIGTCFDTCHAFASGYDIRTEQSFDNVMKEFDNVIGLKYINAIHLNDSKGDLGSRLDRHDHIGQGKIGKTAFSLMMHKFPHVPKVIETDEADNMNAVNIGILRELGA